MQRRSCSASSSDSLSAGGGPSLPRSRSSSGFGQAQAWTKCRTGSSGACTAASQRSELPAASPYGSAGHTGADAWRNRADHTLLPHQLPVNHQDSSGPAQTPHSNGGERARRCSPTQWAMSRSMKVAGAVMTAAALASSGAEATVGFSKPKVYRVAPDARCRTTVATIHHPPGQTGPNRKRISIPPAPGLKATALSNSSVRIDWSLSRTPKPCRTRSVFLSIGRYADWLPNSVSVDTHGSLTGSKRLTWYAPSKPPDVALASAVTRDGRRSHVVGVLIDR